MSAQPEGLKRKNHGKGGSRERLSHCKEKNTKGKENIDTKIEPEKNRNLSENQYARQKSKREGRTDLFLGTKTGEKETEGDAMKGIPCINSSWGISRIEGIKRKIRGSVE